MTSQPDIRQTISQFTNDLCTTFPECEVIISKWWGDSDEQQEYDVVWKHCSTVYPPLFLDILNENADMFSPDSDISVEFLPGLDFKPLWNSDISDTTKSTIWKYLQLISITVMGTTNETDENTAKMFENMNNENFQEKLQETMKNLQDMFPSQATEDETDTHETDTDTPDGGNSGQPKQGQGQGQMPFNFENIKEHLSKLMEGKIGKMAQELAEETAEDLDIDLENETEAADVFKKLMSNPAKLMEVAKKCGKNMKDKIKSGEISESELQAEIMGLMAAMNPSGATNGTGMNGLKEMMSSMGFDMDALMKQFMGGGGGGGGNAKMDVTKMNAMKRKEDTKQRMRANLAEKTKQKEDAQKQATEAQTRRELEYKPMTDAEIALLNSGIMKPPNSGEKKANKKKKKK